MSQLTVTAVAKKLWVLLFGSVSKVVYPLRSMCRLEGALSVGTVAVENGRMSGFGSGWILKSKSTCVD